MLQRMNADRACDGSQRRSGTGYCGSQGQGGTLLQRMESKLGGTLLRRMEWWWWEKPRAERSIVAKCADLVELRVHHDRLLLILAGGRRKEHTQRDVRHAHLQLGVKAAAKERMELARFL